LTRNFSVALGDEGLFEEHEDETSHTFRDNSRQSARSTGKHDENTSGSNTPLISGAFKASDREAVEMSRFLAKRDGLFLGSSSCVNIVGATKLALQLGPGHRVVTIACDGGGRHLSKFWSAEYLEKHGLTPVARGLEFLET
jgi:cysteine synthase A